MLSQTLQHDFTTYISYIRSFSVSVYQIWQSFQTLHQLRTYTIHMMQGYAWPIAETVCDTSGHYSLSRHVAM